MAKDANAGIIFAASSDTVLIGLFYAQPTNLPAVFAPFYSIQPEQYLDNNQNGTIAGASALVDGGSSDRVQFYSRAMSYKTDLETYELGFAGFDALKAFNPSNANDVMQFGIQGITAAAVEAGKKRGGNLLGMEAVSTNWWYAVTHWDEHDATIAQKAASATIDMYNNMTAISKETGKYLDFVFPNDAASDQPSPLGDTGQPPSRE